MMAIDQRDSLRRALARATGQESEQVSAADMTRAKAVITKMLAPYATAVLTDPVYGYPQSISDLPPRVGLLLA
jgi:tagatose 1,6-diphosphate aldolase